MRRLSLLLMVFLLGAPLAVSAQVYKWTDAHGIVHYSDSRPPHGTKYTLIKVAADATAPAPQANTRADTNADTSDANTSDNATSSARPSGPVADTPANRQKLCANLTSNMALLKQDKPVVMRGPNGKNQLLSKQRKAAQLAKAQKQYQAFCQS